MLCLFGCARGNTRWGPNYTHVWKLYCTCRLLSVCTCIVCENTVWTCGTYTWPDKKKPSLGYTNNPQNHLQRSKEIYEAILLLWGKYILIFVSVLSLWTILLWNMSLTPTTVHLFVWDTSYHDSWWWPPINGKMWKTRIVSTRRGHGGVIPYRDDFHPIVTTLPSEQVLRGKEQVKSLENPQSRKTSSDQN